MNTKNSSIAISILIISSLLMFSSCDNVISGSGRIVEENREVNSFDAIDISGSFKIYLLQGNKESLIIEADDNLMQYIQTSVRGGRLYLDTRGMRFYDAKLTAHITVKNLEDIKASGAVKVINESPLDFDRLSIGLSGAADVDLELYGDNMELRISGAAKTNFSGSVENMFIKLSGAAKLNAGNLDCETMDIGISGAGAATVNVSKKIKANISGAGHIKYFGDPEIDSSISGAGKLSKAD